MAHWQHRDEPRWKEFQFNQPYARGLKRLKEEVLAKTDFDPTTLWQWGTMQAMALIETLRAVEQRLGEEGQRIVAEAIRKTGLDVGRQVLVGTKIPNDMTEAEFVSFYATIINRIVYASLETPKIDATDKVSFHIDWCPHQDHYQAFDCRVQRYFVQGMIAAAREHGGFRGWEVKFDQTIPAGAETCHFTLWKATDEERAAWDEYTQLLEAKALKRTSRG